MPVFDLDVDAISFPLLGNSLIIGVFSLLHIAFAALAVGFMILAPLLETADRLNPFYEQISRSLTRFTVITYSVSTVLAVFMVELSIGLFPVTTMWIWNQFRWPILVAIAAFLMQLAALYPYYHYWDVLRQHNRRTHILLGFSAALFILIWVAVLDGMGSTMLTPDTDGPIWGRLLNPTWIPLIIHRFFGNLVLAGFVMAAYAGWRLSKSGGAEDDLYYLHFLRIGTLIGVVALILQPMTGFLYAVQIEQTAPRAYAQLTDGPYQPLLYLQFGLVGGLFVGGFILLRSMLDTPPAPTRGLLTALILSALVTIFFASDPPVRRPVTLLLAGLMVWSLYQWRAAVSRIPTEVNRPMVCRMALSMAAAALLMYWTMGTIRETARRPDTVRGVISLQDEARTPAADRLSKSED